jgi:hypothetical protein
MPMSLNGSNKINWERETFTNALKSVNKDFTVPVFSSHVLYLNLGLVAQCLVNLCRIHRRKFICGNLTCENCENNGSNVSGFMDFSIHTSRYFC